ncbi:MAG TPA: cation diffusion facilitator family transporter [Pseudonocardia sp.]|uniref:cation diffusion facilitator family transporter n=1 Tax=Pseudonocardia sp. TaxID=60912 RepID=UPI002B4B7D44|nr:cation diffusion facilitator family transporter [Pseudonocardia sp.]HLU59461.1 cation diffusion facilitator family transporter [Pseudonocardia sp.]
MGAGHGHGIEAGASASGRHSRRLAISLGVLVASLVLQVVVGLLTSSLALLSDAGHNFTDVLGMAMALAAITAARAARSDDRRTFGLYRAEVLAALANAVLLFGVAAWVVVEAVQRFADPPEVPGLPLLLTALVGLAANLFVFALLRRGAKESLNIRGAYLEVVADTLGSVGVLVAGAVTLLFGWRYADPIVAIAIGLFILPRTFSLGRQAVRILVQAAPAHVDVAAVRAELGALEGVQDVHDVHVWTLTSGMEVGSAHLAVGAGCDPAAVLTSAQRLLTERHQLAHFTLQVEPPGCRTGCAELSW